MSSSYNLAFGQSFIPCAPSEYQSLLENGGAAINIDGKPVSGGVKIVENGVEKCVVNNGKNTNLYFYMGGFQGAPYSTVRNTVANNVHAARSVHVGL